jgi:hypothetical protein
LKKKEGQKEEERDREREGNKGKLGFLECCFSFLLKPW